jgi:hypothetical protein
MRLVRRTMRLFRPLRAIRLAEPSHASRSHARLEPRVPVAGAAGATRTKHRRGWSHAYQSQARLEPRVPVAGAAGATRTKRRRGWSHAYQSQRVELNPYPGQSGRAVIAKNRAVIAEGAFDAKDFEQRYVQVGQGCSGTVDALAGGVHVVLSTK